MKRIITITILIFTCSSLLAQKKKDVYSLIPTLPIQVDGNLEEWGNQLTLIDQDSSWSFGLSNDAEFMYVAVAIKDAALQQDAVRNGIILNIDKDGKKKDGAMLVFPIPDSETLRAMANDENLPNMNVREELIKRSRGYGVKGFAHIVDGRLSFDNNYGVKAIAGLSNKDVLLYEAKVPLSAIGIKDPKKKIAIQLMINNRYSILQKVLKNQPAQNRGIYGGVYGRGYTPTLKNPYKMKTDIWIIGPLN